ncbi:enoyl-CoA hydratase-related protein [Hoeflea sp. 108]|jgi:crotonobetainyl-CoA hydratase|uniref:enoyl-CoA hydratase-related protein n=1 Tax=Hoeflea sp. 108 TaxID=1116369 RepID=UPI000371F66F|nr:enoyl-CoA hydratase-related protein [Hoeflea sp. 108]
MTVLYELKDHVARVTIDRPEVMNAVDAETQAALTHIWSRIEADPDVRCVVLTGSGERAFSAGADMKSGSEKRGLDYWASMLGGGFGGISTRTTLNVPVIARVNGLALGGGFEMVLGCDIVIASNTASFGLPEPRFGRLALAGGITQLSQRIPRAIAMGMLLTGARIDAAEAHRVGLVNEIVEPAQLDAAVDRWVSGILACAPLSLKAVKEMVRAVEQYGAYDASGMRLPALMTALGSSDQHEGVTAFREKRAPVWQGR